MTKKAGAFACAITAVLRLEGCNTYPLEVNVDRDTTVTIKCVFVVNRLEGKRRQTLQPLELGGRTRVARFPAKSHKRFQCYLERTICLLPDLEQILE